MGAWIDFTHNIDIANESWEGYGLKFIGYRDLTSELMEKIVRNPEIKWIQIGKDLDLPRKAYRKIDQILERRQDIYFRIYGIYGDESFDLSVLGLMPHLTKVQIDAHLTENNTVNLEYLCELPNLKGLHLEAFGCRDYSFIKNLSPDLEELAILADTVSGGIQFDCGWLLRYERLCSLFLGKKAKKHLESISGLPALKKLTLRGIKVADFHFLKELSLESFALLYCGNNDLSGLGELETLRELELWRILKLENLDFISSLVNLETLKLQDLSHVKTLPDMSGLKKLADIQVDNVPLDMDTLDASVRKLIHSFV